ncbi:MAG: hypothetical protein HY738_00950 [Bacteroidia bacterium]|nr:hypothetical protein [Bacteroidia bacterium]
MKIRILLILSAIFQVYALIYAGNNKTIFLKSPENNFKLSDNSQSGFKVTNNIAEIRTFYVNTPEGIFTQLQIGGYCKNNKTGEPLLPVFNKLIEIPRNAIVEVNVISYEAETVNLAELGINYPVIPCQPSVSKSADPSEIIFQINKALYSTDNFTKLTLADVKVLGAMRGVMVGRLTICPFQYNPVSNILKIYNNLQVEIKFINPDYEKTNYLKAKYYTPYFDACYNKLINYSDKGFKDTITQYPVKYVIVSDPMFQDTGRSGAVICTACRRY